MLKKQLSPPQKAGLRPETTSPPWCRGSSESPHPFEFGVNSDDDSLKAETENNHITIVLYRIVARSGFAKMEATESSVKTFAIGGHLRSDCHRSLTCERSMYRGLDLVCGLKMDFVMCSLEGECLLRQFEVLEGKYDFFSFVNGTFFTVDISLDIRF